MSLFKDAAVALRRFEYSETSQILVFFTRAHGKQRLKRRLVRLFLLRSFLSRAQWRISSAKSV